MKIFFTASYYGKPKYQRYYDMVLGSINKMGDDVDLISPEVGNYKLVLDARTRGRIKDQQVLHYEAIRKGILLCDATIIEVSHEDFQLGHEATLAIQNGKPVLCLSIHEDFSLKIKNRNFYGGKYNRFNLDELVHSFIARVRRESLDQRFNFFLSKSQFDYLRREADVSGQTASEFLRGLIAKEMK